MKKTPHIVVTCLNTWSSYYDNPTAAKEAILKYTERDYNADAENRACEALEKYYYQVSKLKRKLSSASVKFDLPEVIESSLEDAGWIRHGAAFAAPEITNSEGDMNFRELSPGQFEDISDLGPDETSRG